MNNKYDAPQPDEGVMLSKPSLHWGDSGQNINIIEFFKVISPDTTVKVI
jgi:hypothetical protein